MNKEPQAINDLYERDLDRLIVEIEKLPEEMLWQTPPGVNNSCGVLVQHIIGNLRHYIGKELGNSGYERDREREFTETGVPAASLIREARELKETLFHIFKEMDMDVWEGPYPGEASVEGSTRKFVIHLYGHLNYHLGQVNYLRRIMVENKS